MIAKYPGKCFYCGQPITVGRDTYDLEKKKSYHEACREAAESLPDDEQFKIADRLGYTRVSWEHLFLVLGDTAHEPLRDGGATSGRNTLQEVPEGEGENP